MTGLLVLVRHGQSTDNEADLFSGWRDPELTAEGVDEARRAGRILKSRGLVFDAAFSSSLKRTKDTLDLILQEMGGPRPQIVSDKALNERDYGELSGLNKDQSRAAWGLEQVYLWRKSYDAVPPGGESLAMTAARMLPFWEREIGAQVVRGQQVLVVAHGNSLRSIIAHIERLAPDDVEALHVATSEILVYRCDADNSLVKVAKVDPV